MALFTDGNVTGVDELRAYESDILDLASGAGMELSAKSQLASDEMGIEIEEFLRKRVGDDGSLHSVAGSSLSQVVVTPALERWHALRTLELIFSDLNGRIVGNRFEGKWKEYERRAKWAAETLYRSGVGLVSSPIPRAEPPEIRALPGSLAGVIYHVCVAWKDDRGESGAPSAVRVISVPETGVIGVRATEAPTNAVGFDVYAGETESMMVKQNEAPIGASEEWVMPETGLRDGAEPPTGQEPDLWLRNDRVLQRG